jgi:MbtH protein
MSRDESEDNTIYKVVVNHEEQYSIWPTDRENALGWSDAGKIGTKQECLAYIEEVWTDMRPLSLRKKMEVPRTRPVDDTQHPAKRARRTPTHFERPARCTPYEG